MEGEKYLGGVDSIQLRKGLFAGYGVYATDRRIFGVKRRRAAEPLEIGKESSSQDQIVQELEQRRDFQVSKEDISIIEMKSPPGIFRMGHLLVKLNSGQDLEVKIGKQREFELLKNVMMTFFPEKVRIQAK